MGSQYCIFHLFYFYSNIYGYLLICATISTFSFNVCMYLSVDSNHEFLPSSTIVFSTHARVLEVTSEGLFQTALWQQHSSNCRVSKCMIVCHASASRNVLRKYICANGPCAKLCNHINNLCVMLCETVIGAWSSSEDADGSMWGTMEGQLRSMGFLSEKSRCVAEFLKS